VAEAEIEILNVVTDLSIDPARVGKKDIYVWYRVTRPQGVNAYRLIIPVEQATEAEIIKRIEDAEKERGKLIGRKIILGK